MIHNHFNGYSPILRSRCPGMTKRIGSDRRLQMQGSCQVLQIIIKSTKSGLIFPVTSFIFPFLIPTKNIKQIIRTIGVRTFLTTELVNHFLCSIQHFHAHRSFGFDTIVSQHILIQSRLLQMG